WGPRAVVAAGGAAMAAGVAALGVVARPWHLYPAFLVMALGWGTLSGAAINIIVAPWFQRRRGGRRRHRARADSDNRPARLRASPRARRARFARGASRTRGRRHAARSRDARRFARR